MAERESRDGDAGKPAAVDDCLLGPNRVHDDDRGRRVLELFDAEVPGEIDITVVYPDRIVAWHRHKRQTDHWFVVRGELKVGLLDEAGNHRWVYLSEGNRQTLTIPPGVWHGYMSLGDREVILLYYLTQKYDPANPDEERMSIEDAGIDWSVPIR